MNTYRIEIDFCGFIGCTEIYEVEADTEEEAREQALQMAMDDLNIVYSAVDTTYSLWLDNAR